MDQTIMIMKVRLDENVGDDGDNSDNESQSSRKTTASSFVADEAIEAGRLRQSLKRAGVQESIVKVVAVNSNSLSEML